MKNILRSEKWARVKGVKNGYIDPKAVMNSLQDNTQTNANISSQTITTREDPNFSRTSGGFNLVDPAQYQICIECTC